jgi:hypothetical protein
MSRAEVCKNCCPDGGALFDRDFGCYPHMTTGEMMQEDAWVKVCRNCGHYKLPRKTKPRLTFDEILERPDDTGLRSKRDRAIFHAFAEAGAWKRYSRLCDAYEAACAERGVTKWPLLMHKWMNDHHYRKLTDAEKLNAWSVNYHIRELEAQARRALEILNRDFGNQGAAA